MSRFIEMNGADDAIFVEVDDSASDSLELVGAKVSSSSLTSMMSALIKNGKLILMQSRDLSPSEIELEFGIKGGIEAGVPIWGLAKASGEGNITVKLHWKDEKSEALKERERSYTMTENFKNFQDKFKTETLTIYETKYWRWSLRPVQVTIGSGILSLKRPAERFSDITENESKDLVEIVKVIEKTLDGLFHYKRMNYLMLMMVDYHVHFHAIPRYDEPIECIGKSWNDEAFPKPVAIAGTPNDNDTLISLLEYMKGHVKA